MLKSRFNLGFVLLLGGAMISSGQGNQSAKEQETKLLAVLKSDAARKEKADACRELARIASADAVPVLAGMLADEQLTHMARYAMETIPSPAVDDAFRAALGTLKGRPLVGVIGSIGVRRDAKAVQPLSALLGNTDAEVALAAARALGKIGNADAAKALTEALPGVPAANQLAFCEGLFRCAETLAAKGERKEAMGIYDKLRVVPSAPHQVRAGALRGAVLTRGNDGVPLLVEAIRGNDFVLVAAAARTAMEMPGANVTQALADELSRQPADKQILLIQTLGRRGDAGALPALFALARTAGGPVRIAAIRVLPEIGGASAVPVLVELLWNADREVAEAAKSGLAGFPGPEASTTIAGLLNKSSVEQRLVAMDLVARRRMTETIPTLRQAASDNDARIRAAALRRLGELGGMAEMPALLGLLSKAASAEDLTAIGEALSALCARVGDSEACSKQLIAQLPSAKPAQKAALLHVLVTAGGANSLEAIRSGVKDSNAEVHAAAVEALNSWTSAEAATDLLALAKTGGSSADKQLGLRGYLRWAADGDVPPARRLEMCREAGGLVERTEEKRMLLAALGGINQPRSLSLILPFLDDAAVREEACVAAVTVSEKMTQGRNVRKLTPEQIAGLEKIAQVTKNAELAKRAKVLAGSNK